MGIEKEPDGRNMTVCATTNNALLFDYAQDAAFGALYTLSKEKPDKSSPKRVYLAQLIDFMQLLLFFIVRAFICTCFP